MTGLRGVLVGAFALIVLQVLVREPYAYGAVGGLFDGAAKAARWFLDPNMPGIPDRSSSGHAAQPSSTVVPSSSTTTDIAQAPVTA